MLKLAIDEQFEIVYRLKDTQECVTQISIFIRNSTVLYINCIVIDV